MRVELERRGDVRAGYHVGARYHVGMHDYVGALCANAASFYAGSGTRAVPEGAVPHGQHDCDQSDRHEDDTDSGRCVHPVGCVY